MTSELTKQDWHLGELLAAPDKLYILWLRYEGFWHNLESFRKFFGNDASFEGVLANLIDQGFLKTTYEGYSITELGRKALASLPKDQHTPSPLDQEMLVTQIRSSIGRDKYQKQVLAGLGLNRVNKTTYLKNTPEIRGMINKVRHLVRVGPVWWKVAERS